MRKIISCMTVAGLGFATLTGCGQPEDPHAELEQAVQRVLAADRSDLDVEATPLSLLSERREALQQSIAEIESAIRAGEGPSQAAARRLLADVYASIARIDAGQAMEQYSGLMSRSPALAAYLRSLDGSASRVAQLEEGDQGIREQLQQEIRDQQARQAQLQQQRQQLQTQLQELQEQRDEQAQLSLAAMTEMTQLTGEAFMAEGDEQYDLEAEAAQARRRAEEFDTAAELHQIDIDAAQAEVQLLDAQLQRLDEVLDNLADEVEQRRQRDQQRITQRDAAEQDRTAAAEQLAGEFDETWSVYQASVDQPLIEAVRMLDDAMDQINLAVNQADSQVQTHAQLGLAGMHVEKAHLLSRHQMMTRAILQTLDMIVAGPERGFSRQQIEQFTEARNQLAARHSELRSQMQEVTDQGLQLAGELADRGGDVAEQAHAYRTRLNELQQRQADTAAPIDTEARPDDQATSGDRLPWYWIVGF